MEAKLYFSCVFRPNASEPDKSYTKELWDIGHLHLIVPPLLKNRPMVQFARVRSPRFHQNPAPVTYTDINMDMSRDLSRLAEPPRFPASPNLDKELDEFFDWDRYYNSTGPPFDKPHTPPPFSPARQASQNLTPLFINGYSLEDEFFKMKTSFRGDDEATTISESSGQTPPELIQGGSTPTSDHSASGSVILEYPDESYHHRSGATLRDFQAHDDEWTIPQAGHSPKAGPGAYYAPRLRVQEDPSRFSGTKRRRSGDDLQKRHRQLADPIQTADVRKMGACLPCRVSKTRVRPYHATTSDTFPDQYEI